MCLFRSVCLSLSLSLCVTLCVSVCLSLSVSLSLSLCLSVSLCLSLCLSLSLSLTLSLLLLYRLALGKKDVEAVYEEAREEADLAIEQSRASPRESSVAAGDMSEYTLVKDKEAGGRGRRGRKRGREEEQRKTLSAGDFIGYQCKVRGKELHYSTHGWLCLN
jgi:hypothetical protein